MGHRKILFRMPFRGFSTFLLTLALISFHSTHVATIKMISTSTQTPQSLTTPKDSAKDKAALKDGILDYVNLATSMKNLKRGEDILTNSSQVENMEKELTEFQDMVREIEKHYGFRLKQDSSRECSLDYSRKKRILIQEFEALLNDCKEAMNRVDVLHFKSETDSKNKLIVHGCSERAKTIPMDVTRLLSSTYRSSYACAVESVRNLVNEMVKSKHLTYLHENSDLLLEELDYLQRNEENILGVLHPEINRTEYPAWTQMTSRKVELEKMKRVLEKNVMKKAIINFTNTVDRILDGNRTKEEVIAFALNPEAGFIQFANFLKQNIFENHLKIPNFKEDSVESWASSPGVFKIVFMNNLLKDMMAKTAVNTPKSGTFRLAQQDLAKTYLFTGISSTFGKPCENSPGHLVGTCTAENHELCRQIVVNWGTDDDQELLPQDELMLMGNVELKHCTCGFRTNCDKGSRKSTCFLIPNSEGQCRGGEGYPCKTQPLELGRYDESCVSGYCNRQKNSCEPNEIVEVGLKRFQRIVRKRLERLAALL